MELSQYPLKFNCGMTLHLTTVFVLFNRILGIFRGKPIQVYPRFSASFSLSSFPSRVTVVMNCDAMSARCLYRNAMEDMHCISPHIASAMI